MVQMFVPSVSRPTRQEIEKEIQKLYPDAKVMSFLPRDLEPGEPTVMMGEEKRDEYGDIVGGPKISKKKKAKNLAKNEKDEQHTTTTSEMVDLPKFSQDSVSKAKGADSSFIKPNSQKRRVTMRDKMKEIKDDPKGNKAKEDAMRDMGEAKMPVKGLVKLAAMVADNNKKRKNALQIQKYIGEDKKMGRQSDEALAAAHKKFSSMDQTSPANSFMTKRIQKEIDRRKKAEH